MKRHLLHIVLLFCAAQAIHAQEDGVVAFNIPARNSLKFNRHIINPTFSFVREQHKYISFNNKREWVQFDDAPQTYLFGYAGRFRENIGAGVSLFQQNNGVLSTFGGIVNFAYNAVLNRDSNLTFGMNLGFYKSGINTGNVVTNLPDSSIDNVPSNSIVTINPGINYGTDFLDFGISVNNLVSYNFTSSKMIEDNPEQSFKGHFMYTGYINNRGFFDESRFSGLVTTAFKKDQTVISGMAMLMVPKGIWGQVGYNSLYAISVGVGLNITSQIAIEYNYDKGIGGFSTFGNSHDITVAYKFNNRYRYSYSGDDEEEALLIPSNKRRRPVAKRRKPSKPTVRKRVKPVVATKKEISPNKPTMTNTEPQNRKQVEEAKIKAAQEEQIRKVEAKARQAEAARIRAEQEEQARRAETARVKAEAEAKAKQAEAARIKAGQEEQARRAETARVKAEAEAKARQAEAARIKAEQEEQARIAEAERVKAEAEAKARQAEVARIKAEQEEQTRLAEAAKETLIDEDMAPLNAFKESIETSKSTQEDLLNQLSEKVAVKQKDLDDLKEENDLSEKGIFKAPKAFKSVSAENAEIESLKLKIDNTVQLRSDKITEIETLYRERLKKVRSKNDKVNLAYLEAIETLRIEQQQALSIKQQLVSTLEDIKVATDYERKRRIKRAAYDNETDRYYKDRATLERIKKFTEPSPEPLTREDFDTGETLNNIQIVKDVNNTDNGYYLVVAVHSNVEKRDEFLEKTVAAGEKNINFFFDVNTSKYYIYYEKFDDIGEAKSALDANKGNKPYNSKMSMVKIEN